MIKVTWPELKNIIDSKGLFPQHIETVNYYIVYAVDGAFTLETKIDRTVSNADLTQFETSYKPRSNTNLWQYDADGAQIVRLKAARRGWTYGAIGMEFSTSTLSNSLISLLSDNSPRTGISLKLFNALGVEITVPGLANANLLTATRTVIDFEPPYDYELIGGSLRTLTTIMSDIRMWIVAVPDVPAPMGSKEMAGALNLRYLAPGNEYHVDGRVSKLLSYNAQFHTNKLRFIFDYPPGTAENISVVIELYRA